MLVLGGSIVEVANTNGFDEWSERRWWCGRRGGSSFAGIVVVIIPFVTLGSVRLGLSFPIGRHDGVSTGIGSMRKE